MEFPFHMPAASEFDAVGFGTNAVDHLICVPEYPAFDSKVEFTAHLQAAGGEVASTMAGLRKLGLTTAYVGRFGSDAAGEMGLASLAEAGVDVRSAEVVQGAATQIAFIIIDARTGERTIIWHRDEKLAYAEGEAPTEAAVLGRVLHLTPHDTRACIRMATAAREKGVVVSIDVDNVFDDIEDLLPLVDVCIMSAAFPQKMLGTSDVNAALSEISGRFGTAVTGLTLGSAGSIFLCGGSVIETPGFEVPGGCIDTTGAGDAFRTGFLFAMLSGETVEESARTANAVAALKCRGLGARSALPDRNELDELLGNA